MTISVAGVIDHIAFNVDDIESLANLQSAGVTILICQEQLGKQKAMFFEGPRGND